MAASTHFCPRQPPFVMWHGNNLRSLPLGAQILVIKRRPLPHLVVAAALQDSKQAASFPRQRKI